MVAQAVMGPQILVRDRWVPEDLERKLQTFNPRTELGRLIQACFRFLPPEQVAELIERVSSVVVVESSLGLTHRGARFTDRLGVVSRKVVTDNGVAYIVDAFQNLVELENQRYHGLGTGSTAEAASQTALVAELTTQYSPDNTRATGTTTESAANAYRTVGTNTVDAAAAVTEHGVFSAATGGVLLDRSAFAVVNLAASDALESTYTLTFTAGG